MLLMAVFYSFFFWYETTEPAMAGWVKALPSAAVNAQGQYHAANGNETGLKAVMSGHFAHTHTPVASLPDEIRRKHTGQKALPFETIDSGNTQSLQCRC